jgi:nitrite reductase/ring-hydroxylating ferredoxin subunit
VAIFRNGDKVHALSNVCQHQNGPLGEGCIRDGLVTCPWHGYQYQPEDGASPAPFTEKIPTFNVRIEAGRVLVDPRPNPAGTPATFGLAVVPALVEDRPFFVGYLPAMPASLVRFLKSRVFGLLGVAALLGGLLAAPQRPFGSGSFEFGSPRTFVGLLVMEGYPSLLLDQPQAASSQPALSRYLLVGMGKHGAASTVQGKIGQRVQLMGTLIQREGLHMIEVVPDSVRLMGQSQGPNPTTSLGTFTLRGEIVDSKCFLGVMKPGNLKPHKSCAIRCISGGVPPVLVIRDAHGHALYVVLEGEGGQALNEEVLPFVAEPVELTGNVERREDLLVLCVKPGAIRRI